MSRNSLDFDFADGEYSFALPLPQIRELQDKTGIGIGGLYARLLKGVVELPTKVFLDPAQAEFYAEDIIETIRQALIGGKRGIVNGQEVEVSAATAERLIRNYVLPVPLFNHWHLAVAIIGVCIKGYDPPKKDEPAGERAAETTESPETEPSTTD